MTGRAEGLAGLRPLLGEINDAKRVRAAGRASSLAGRAFARSWAALVAGEPPGRVARREAAAAVCSARLGGIDAAVLVDAGLGRAEVLGVLRRAVREAAGGALGPGEVDGLLDEVDGLPDHDERFGGAAAVPSWVAALDAQPRAGATRPGHPRLILEPAESHAEHCHVTAVYAALVAPRFGADPAGPFLAGLAHHLHNAYLPDSGYAGEELLGEHLAPAMERFTARAMAELPAPLAAAVEEARGLLPHVETPEARAFHAADVIDRVLQMDQYARVAAFELRQALEDLDLVHPGPLQAFHLRILADAGLRP